MNDLTPKELADLRRWLGGMQSLAERESIYDGNASVCSIVVRVLSMLDHLARMREARDNARAEVERLAALVDAVRAWVDRRGVNVGDRDDEYMRGYRDAQRHALQDALKLRRALDGEADHE